MSEIGELHGNDTSPAIQRPAEARPHVRSLLDVLGLRGLPYPEAKKKLLATFNDAYVSELLGESGGNVSEAARRSGLDRSNFRRLLRSTSLGRARSGDSDGERG